MKVFGVAAVIDDVVAGLSGPDLGNAGTRGNPSVIASVQDLGALRAVIIEEKHAYETA